MRVLVLGGTSFVGRAIVEELLDTGAQVSLFSRGQTGTGLFPAAERLVGDRDTGDYTALEPGRWDGCVDVSGYVPRHVGQAGEVLQSRVGRYLFISTGSVYDVAQMAAGGADEDSPRKPPERGTEEITGDTYGRLKVACEDDVTARFAERATVVRPGVVAGPHDPSDRFTWWVRRAARGGRVALAARPDQPVQVIDSRDLARLVVRLLADDRPGTFNAVGPADPVTFAGMVQACAAAAGSTVDLVPLPVEAVDPPLPLVYPDPADDPLGRRSSARARAVGLTATPLQQTAADVLAWDRERGEPRLAEGISPGQEAALLAPGRRA